MKSVVTLEDLHLNGTLSLKSITARNIGVRDLTSSLVEFEFITLDGAITLKNLLLHLSEKKTGDEILLKSLNAGGVNLEEIQTPEVRISNSTIRDLRVS